MKNVPGTPLLPTALLLAIAIHAGAIETNPADLPPTNSAPAARLEPLIKMDNVLITTAIEVLARQASINYLIAPQVEEKWRRSGEPIVNFELRNVVAKDVLRQILTLHHLALMEDPASNIAFIIPADQITNPLYAGMATNQISQHTNLIPLIQFSDVPITTAIENLARQAGVNYMMDPKVLGQWDNSSAIHGPEPLLSMRFESITCWAALNRILNIYGLVLVENPVSQIARITFAGEPLRDVHGGALDLAPPATVVYSNNIIPLIQFTDAPLDIALKDLASQISPMIALDPRLMAASGPPQWFAPMPMISLRWENMTARQALVSLCENYDLVITNDKADGLVLIKPDETKKNQHPSSP